eukprot:gnl/TRDRNA2_/TRDRNA2_188404_c0_seq1.p1 gnl/TRDRNA2_/TRDRNA2_188404_c0~~gnl/TRDRNA2_/TRDRNA2_188404_c0_seq1.p1  ORF type:complete len:315 (+),score=90.25 gnl/TRDRNA2_/TRDRNA2_188404_c0_seq1:61-1005(+)
MVAAAAATVDEQQELEDPTRLRRELRKLQKENLLLKKRAKKASRELAKSKRERKDLESSVAVAQADINSLAKRLGLETCALPESDEWRRLSREHALREKELRRQMEREEADHAKQVEQLEAEIRKGGRPQTAKGLQALEDLELRHEEDEACARMQVVRDYIEGTLEQDGEKLSEEELRALFEVDEQEQASATGAPNFESYQDLVEAVIAEIGEKHQLGLRDLVEFTTGVISEKEKLLRALSSDVLDRSLQDIKACSEADRDVLQELLVDAESIAKMKVKAGPSLASSSSDQGSSKPPARRANRTWHSGSSSRSG